MVHEAGGYWAGFVAGARPGQEYRFRLHTATGEYLRIDPYAAAVTSSIGNAVIYDHAAFDWAGDAFELPGHHELVVYELHTGSFLAPDPNRPGTFCSVRERLDHLVRLGVNVIQLMPVAEFAGDYSWGYNPSHIFAVETAYGGPDALKTLVRDAHRAGLGVVIDVVYNHFGPSDLDLWRFDGWSVGDGGGIYFYNDDRAVTPWGHTRPDYGREEVRRFIHDNAMAWLRDYHADGLRFDMTPYIRSVHGGGIDLPHGWDLMRWINLSVREQFPRALTVAEDMHHDPRISQVHDHGAAFHAQWCGAFVHPIRRAVTVAHDADRCVEEMTDAIAMAYNGDACERVIYTESHDEVANGRARVPHEVNADDPHGWHAQKRSTLGAALVFTSPGIPMIFQGQEFLQGEWFRDDVPLDWDLSLEFHGIIRLYADLIRLRRNLDGRSRGLTGHHVDVYHRNNPDNVLVMHRWDRGGPADSVVVVVNLSHVARSDYRIGLPSAGVWSLALNSDAVIYSDDFGGHESFDLVAEPIGYDGQPASAVLSIGPYTTLIYTC